MSVKLSKFTKRDKISGFAGLFAIVAGTTSLDAASVTIGGHMAGPTPFIRLIDCTVNPASAFETVQFTIASKPGSVVRPVSAVYSAEYLQGRGYFNPQNGQLVLPVFGLYDNYSNRVVLRFRAANSVKIWKPSSFHFHEPSRCREQFVAFDYNLLH
jgi:Arylsulfotransferase Ig-like domain